LTYGHGELVYFIIKPTNISVLSEASIAARIYALMTVLKGMAEIEMLCLNSRENFEDNKRFLRNRIEQEDNPTVRKLLEADLTFLDRIQVQMATAREFLIVIRLQDENLTFTPRGQSVYLVNCGTVHRDLCSELPTLRNIQHQTKKQNSFVDK